MGSRGRCHLRASTCFLLLIVTASWSHPLSKRKPQSQLPIDLWTSSGANSLGIRTNVLSGAERNSSSSAPVSNPVQLQDKAVASDQLRPSGSKDQDQEPSVFAVNEDQLQNYVAQKVKNITVKLKLEHFNMTQTDTLDKSSSQAEMNVPVKNSVVDRFSFSENGAVEVDSEIDNRPYVAFNIWTYEGGELKLSAVKKIPAEEVLGSDFYAQVTENPNEPVIVLADSFVISKRNSSEPMLPLLQPFTSAVTRTTTTTTTERPQVTGQMNIIPMSAEVEFPSDDVETLALLLNSDSSLSSYFPNPLVSPIGNIYDFVSFIINNSTEKSSLEETNPPALNDLVEAEKESEVAVVEVIESDISEVAEPAPVQETEHKTETEQMAEEVAPVSEVGEMPETEQLLETIPEPEPEHDIMFESMAETDNIQEMLDTTDIQQEEQASEDLSNQIPTLPESSHSVANTITSLKGESESSVNSVMLTPQGVKFASSLDESVKANAIKLLSAIDDHSLMFNINQSSMTPHKIQVSLINDEGFPTNETSLINADLISIISNKPTIINHNIYQIVQGGYLPSNNNGNFNDDMLSSKPYLVSSTQVISDVTQAIYPPSSSNQTKSSLKNGAMPPQMELTYEEQLLLELEKITSFNKIFSGSAADTLSDVSILETLALKGILDAKPELVHLATEQIPGVDKKEPTLPNTTAKLKDVNSNPSNSLQLQVNILPLGSSTSSFPEGSLTSPTPSSTNGNSDLYVLEQLLKNNQLPTEVEIAILSDILAGSSISDALDANLQKFKGTISEHVKLELPYENNPSPLTVIDAIEGNKRANSNSTKPSSEDSSSSHTFIAEVNVATLPPVRANTGGSSQGTSLRDNLANCFLDRACTFAFSLALAAGTTGALTVPFIAPLIGRSVKSSVEIAKAEIPNELMTVEDAKTILAAVTKYAQRNGKTLRGEDHKELRGYLSPYVSYLGHKVFPRIFGSLPHQQEK